MLTLNDGRSELWQCDTGRKLTVDADCSQVHFSNKVFGRSIDVDVVDGVASIPDILLQTDKELTAWAFVGTPENGYTKISKVFKVNKRNKPADYVFTPPEQITLGELVERLEKIEESQDPDAIKNAVDDYLANNPIEIDETDPTVSEWAKQPTKPSYTASEVGALPADTVIPTIPDNVSAFRNDAGYLTEHQDISGKLDASALPTAINTALAQAKANGEFDGEDGTSPVVSVSAIEGGHRITITDTSGTKTVDVLDGSDGQDGSNGSNGKDGNGIKSAVLNADYTLTLTFDDGTSYTTPSIRGATGETGSSGKDGNDGKDGVSVTHSWNGTTLTVTSASGTSSANLKGDKGDKGDTGENGAAGYSPVRGTDYWTDADQTAIVNATLAALPTWTGGSY